MGDPYNEKTGLDKNTWNKWL